MKRNKFSLSNYKLLSCKQGQLVPIGLTEVLPGDTFRQHTSALVRVSPLVHPVMHPCHIAIRHFFVPTRILWDDFQDNFITGGPDGDDNTVAPTITVPGSFGVGSLADYLGVPPVGAGPSTVSAIPFRAYAAIYNEYFRDKQIQPAVPLSTASGGDIITSTDLMNCTWEKDYFTTARLEPQLGPDVTISIGGDAPILRVSNAAGPLDAYDVGTNTPSPTNTVGISAGNFLNTASSTSGFTIDPNGSLIADLSAVTGISINEVREAFAQQSFQEHRSRFGDTYVEYLRYLGLQSSDARLQLPEYLGGSKQTIQFSEVLGTADANLGQLGGHGIAATRTNKYQKYFEEHGYVMTLMYVRPKTVYMNGLPRTFSRISKEDYWQKEYEHTGQQEILNKEVYFGHTSKNDVFGYQDVYDEYRRQESSVAGEFRTTMKDWHLARDIQSDAEATLDADFETCTPRTDVYADTASDNLYVMASHNIAARRMIAKTGSSSNL
ncbi:MAG: major capsid protein [Arizlama microvirus]|nr:MAG: major capsid protein [Arizlama microvirus]